jgi:hypothetical protein
LAEWYVYAGIVAGFILGYILTRGKRLRLSERGRFRIEKQEQQDEEDLDDWDQMDQLEGDQV